jgi:predicted Zn-dependent protease
MVKIFFSLFLCLIVMSGCATFSHDAEMPQKQSYKEIQPEWSKSEKVNRIQLAQHLMEKGFYDVALAQLKEEINNGNKDAQIYYLIGTCERERERERRAEGE